MSSENRVMSLKESAKSDYDKKLKEEKTGWGIISADRTSKGISRSDRVKLNKAK